MNVRRLLRTAAAGVLVSLSIPALAGAPASIASAGVVAKTSTKAGGFPSVTVTDIRTSNSFRLSSLASEGKPVVAWFWAPS